MLLFFDIKILVLSNNIVGGEFMNSSNRLFLFWKIGESVFKKQKSCENVIKRVSGFLTYSFGMSETFSISNIRYMKMFYCCFPFYYTELNNLRFEHYKLLVDINDIKKRYFYFRVALFCRSSIADFKYLIVNDIYNYI